MTAISERIDKLDLDLFNTIQSQSSPDDKRSFLALNSAFRQQKPEGFTFLEIGSYKGGSLQAYVADPSCIKIISIDPRPQAVPDERGETYDYSVVSTADMLAFLGKVPGANTSKIHPIEASTSALKPESLPFRPDFCFIDGEHTDESVLRDALFCLDSTGPNTVLAFHDANIVYNGLLKFLKELETRGLNFRAYNLASCVFVIELGECRVSQFEPLRSRRENNYVGYLASLKENDIFREAAQKYWTLAAHPILRLPHKLGLVKLAKKIAGA